MKYTSDVSNLSHHGNSEQAEKVVRWVTAYSTGRTSTIINSNPSAVLREERVVHPNSSLLQYKATAF